MTHPLGWGEGITNLHPGWADDGPNRDPDEKPTGREKRRMAKVELHRELELLIGAFTMQTHLDGTPVVLLKGKGPEPQPSRPMMVIVGTKKVIVVMHPALASQADSVREQVEAERPGYRVACSPSKRWRDVIAAAVEARARGSGGHPAPTGAAQAADPSD